MTLDSDVIDGVRGDYQYADGVDSLSYTVRATSATTTGVRGVPVAPAMAEEGDVAVSKATRRAWWLWADTLGSVVPAAGDTITDGLGRVWVVVEYTGPAMGTSQVYFQCECVLQR